MRKLTTNTTFTSNAHCDLSNLVIFGKTQKVNQLVQNGNFANGTTGWGGFNGTISTSNNELIVITNATGTTAKSVRQQQDSNIWISGHKYFVSCDLKVNYTGNASYWQMGVIYSNVSIQPTTNWQKITYIRSGDNVNDSYRNQFLFGPAYDTTNLTEEERTFKLKNIRIADLTDLYGAGNEPTTVEQFLTDHPEFNDYVDYTGPNGALLSVNGKVTQKVGRNIWNEEWESGSFDLNGNPTVDASRIRTKNPIEVIPNTTYFLNVGSKIIGYRFYDISDNFISGAAVTQGTIISPQNARYLRFSVVNATTYNHDICINESDSLDGTYSPYISGELTLSNLGGVNDVKDIWFGKSPNLWDEEWESGYYNVDNGIKVANNSYIRCKNKIKILPNKQYCFLKSNNTDIRFCYYDIDGNYLSKFILNSSTENGYVFLSANNAHYMTFYVSGTTYNNDICINESNSLINGLYVRHNAENVILRRVEGVDLGTLNYVYVSTENRFYTGSLNNVIKISNRQTELLSAIYKKQDVYNITENMVMYYSANNLYFQNTSYLDAPSFKSGMSGIYLYYELATPYFEYAPTTHDFVQAEGQVEMLCDSQIKPTYLIEYYQLTKSIDGKLIPYYYIDNKLVMEKYSEDGKLMYEFVPQLPAQYQAVEYISSTGTQYIKLGNFVVSQDEKIVCDFTVNSFAPNITALYGSIIDTHEWDKRLQIYFRPNTGEISASFGFGSEFTHTGKIPTLERKIHSVLSFGKVEIDNTKYDISSTSFSEPITYVRFSLFSRDGGENISSTSIKKFYKIKEGLINVYLQPCYNKNTGVIGMYDFVTNTFLINQGTGTFGKGREK